MATLGCGKHGRFWSHAGPTIFKRSTATERPMDLRVLFHPVSLRERIDSLCQKAAESRVNLLPLETLLKAAAMPHHVAKGYLRAQLSGPVREQIARSYVGDPRISAAVDEQPLVAETLQLAVDKAVERMIHASRRIKSERRAA
jgi:hypothetical protein